MATRSPKPCAHPACPSLVYDGTGWCSKHKPTGGHFGSPHRASASRRGYGAQWRRLREQVLDRGDHLCQVCRAAGHVSPAYAVDHIRPKAAGGTDDPANLRAICRDCHRKKTQEEARAGHAGWREAQR